MTRGMELTVNGEKKRIPPEATVADLLCELGLDPAAGGVAVAVNGTVVPAPSWREKRLAGGDTVEIIHAVQGG
jgi:sulfur carrier protein